MIMQKLASAIRRQDWFQVVIEVLIVIVGIYLGFQVTEWGDQRKAKAEQVEYLERLLVDTENSLISQQSDLQRNREIYEGVRTAVLMLFENRVNENNIDEIGKHANLTGERRSLNFYRDTLEEMIASGRLANVASPELKKTIGEFRELMRTNAVVNDTLGREIATQASELRIMLKMDPNHTKVLTPHEQLISDDNFYNHLNNQAYMYLQFNFFQQYYHDATKVFRSGIAAELERLQ